MKKIGVINSEISTVLARMGHTDTIVIADSGLPIPGHVKRIDLAVDLGKPAFIEVLHVVLRELEVEKVTLASEIKQYNPKLFRQVESIFSDQGKSFVSHEQFKKACHEAKAIIRTGENTPYANVILHAGVIF
ncbi:D-ribose pyranase [Shimazuella sp. AN120528]|uniref:D-ribose pyranase n=1 Tax=Shimazuella soli TaxID=1892854 RepID=UPI001F0F921C|nr:D-ribose pyranase [Shimazuella soli]MCH5584299.1 D-ribose pyranase [Shimazuella soli]